MRSGFLTRLVLLFFILVGLIASQLSPAGAHSSADSSPEPFLSADRLIFGNLSGTPEMWLEGSSFSLVELAASAGELKVEKVDLQGATYLTLGGENFGKGSRIGAPDLPVLRRGVEIPFGAQVSLELVSAEYTDVKLSDLGLPVEVLPLQPPQPKCGEAVEPCQPDAKIYQQDAFYPALPVALGDEYEVRGHRAQTVEVWPAAYNPVQGTLRLYSRVRFQLRLKGSQVLSTLTESARLASPAFEQTLANSMLNYNLGKGARAVDEMKADNYLIITADAYYSGLADFVALKQSQGFNVTVAKTSEIGTTTTAIQTYIAAQYHGANPPTYLLLVGDHNDGADSIPAWPFPNYTNYYTDLYYVTMSGSGDYVPDIYRGRFPVRDTAQLANMVNNNLWYANDVTGTEAWVKKAAYLATNDSGHYTIVEGTHNYCIESYTQPKGYTGIFPSNPQIGGDKLYATTYSATTSNVTASLNDGRAMVVYSGHGSQISWAGPSFGQSNVRSLTGNLIPYVVGHACVTADYNTNEAFSDTWVIQNGVGGLVYVGASNNSYWGEDDELQRAIFDTMFGGGDPSIGMMLFSGLSAVQSAYPTSAKYYWEEYNLFGDPSLAIVTGPLVPDFTLNTQPGQVSICGAGSATSTVSVGSLLGYSTPVDLSLSGAPAGVSPTFDPFTVTPAGQSTLTLVEDGNDTPGTYPLTVSATSGAATHTVQVELSLFAATPGTPLLLTPANGAAGQSTLPTLTWEAADQAGSYTLEVALDADFNSLVLHADGLTGTAYTFTTTLASGTQYYWRVNAHNLCGKGGLSEVFTFTTSPAPGECYAGYQLRQWHFADLENGLNGWADASATYHWTTSTAASYSPTHSFLGVDVSAVGDQRLLSPVIVLPESDQQPVTFSFWQSHNFEGAASSCYDGGLIELSTDGGVHWVQLSPIAGSYGYNGTVHIGYSNPLADMPAFCASSNGWQRTLVDLSAYAGLPVQLRLRLGTDASVGKTGWYVDDLQVQACQTIPNYTYRFPLFFR